MIVEGRRMGGAGVGALGAVVGASGRKVTWGICKWVDKEQKEKIFSSISFQFSGLVYK